MLSSWTLCAVLGGTCAPQQLGQATGKSVAIGKLSDEFSVPSTLSKWSRVTRTEGWNIDQTDELSIGSVRPGWLTIIPKTSTWYQDYRGELVFKLVTGNFIVKASLDVAGKQGGPPTSNYSLAGIMLRSPRNITPQTWAPGGENYVFSSIGAADQPGTWQFEIKSTTNSDSWLQLSPATSGTAKIGIARIGTSLVLLRNAGAGWQIVFRYERPDMPATLQSGITVYTDYSYASTFSPFDHNSTSINGGNPDLVANVDYVRYLPVPLGAGSNDAVLIAAMGD